MGGKDETPRIYMYACCGTLRLNRGHLVRGESCINIDKLPRDYLSSLYYDCLTHGYVELKLLINRVGSGRILLGSDFLFGMGLDSPAEWGRNAVGIGENEKELILGGNAVRVLGL